MRARVDNKNSQPSSSFSTHFLESTFRILQEQETSRCNVSKRMRPYPRWFGSRKDSGHTFFIDALSRSAVDCQSRTAYTRARKARAFLFQWNHPVLLDRATFFYGTRLIASVRNDIFAPVGWWCLVWNIAVCCVGAAIVCYRQWGRIDCSQWRFFCYCGLRQWWVLNRYT